MKAFPTDADLAAGNYVDAGAFMMVMRKAPQEKADWLAANNRRFDEELSQPIERATHHLLNMMVRTVTEVAKGLTMRQRKAEDTQCTKDEVLVFRKEGGARVLPGQKK